jgi:arsenical pump membrane protein
VLGAALTLGIFATMLLLVFLRPRRWNEAWWTTLAAAAMLGLGLVTPREAVEATLAGKSALIFLLSLLALSLLLGKSGFFDWAAIRCARLAGGNARALYRNVFLLGALVTATLSLDTTAVILTPIVLALVRRLELRAAPYVISCAFVANVGSLLLPISNLTNLLFAEPFHMTFGAFAARMAVPQGVALVACYALLCRHFRADLPDHFEHGALPEAASVVPSRPYFVACIAVLAAVLVGYFVAPLAGIEPYAVAFVGTGALVVAGIATRRLAIRALGEVSWSVFPFVVGLFVAVRGLENLGLVAAASDALASMRPGSLGQILAAAGGTTLASNAMNNLPAALIARGALHAAQAPRATVLAALVGTDVGPLMTPFGSLATLLVLVIARREGVDVRVGPFVGFGAWASLVLVLAATLALALTFLVVS